MSTSIQCVHMFLIATIFDPIAAIVIDDTHE